MEAKISTLLTEMNVSKSSTEMLATYRGREDQLVKHLRKMKAKMDENAAVATMAAGAVDDRNDAATVATSDSTSNGTANDDDAMNAEIESLLLELDIPKRSREGMLSAYKGREDEIVRHLRTMKARKDNRAAAAKMTTPMAADDTTSDAMSTKETCASSPSFILADNINGGRGHANRRVFITGGSGLVGHQCAETFRAAGWKVVATHCSFPTPVTVRYDCTQPQCPENFDVESFRPHLIIHCAAATHVDQCERDRDMSYLFNVKAVKHIASIAKKCAADLVFISSDYVFDGSAGPYSEGDTPCPLNVYGKHKLEAENYLLGNDSVCGPLSGLKILVLRVTNIYGEDAGRNKNFVSRIISNASKTADASNAADPMTLRLPVDQYATPVDAADIATIIKMLVMDGKSGLYHIAAPEYLSRVQLAGKVLQKVDRNKAEIIPLQTSQLGQMAPRPLKGGLLSSRLQSEYPNFVFRSVDDFLHSSQMISTFCRALPGMYSQYDKPGKHWYAPNKFEAYGEEEIKAVADCLRDGFLAPGPRTEQFEASVSRLYGKKFGLMVNSGSAANLIALSAFGFKPGDEVVTPACTFATTVAPLVQLGVKPIFVDVEEGTYVPSVDAVIKAITPATVLIWLPNLVGSKPDWEGIRKHTSLPLWEDSCDTITETKITDVSISSFYASHMITAGKLAGLF